MQLQFDRRLADGHFILGNIPAAAFRAAGFYKQIPEPLLNRKTAAAFIAFIEFGRLRI